MKPSVVTAEKLEAGNPARGHICTASGGLRGTKYTGSNTFAIENYDKSLIFTWLSRNGTDLCIYAPLEMHFEDTGHFEYGGKYAAAPGS